MKYAIRKLRQLHADQSGLFSLSHLATTMFLALVVVCCFNSGATLSDHARQQRKADAVAQSLGNWKARNLNAVVVHQHMLGEMLALVVTHHGIGGDLLDEQKAADTSKADNKLQAAYLLAEALQANTPAYDDVHSKVLAGEALLEAHKELKKLLTFVYYTKATAKVMQMYPPTAPVGKALEIAADALRDCDLSRVESARSYPARGVCDDTCKIEAA